MLISTCASSEQTVLWSYSCQKKGSISAILLFSFSFIMYILSKIYNLQFDWPWRRCIVSPWCSVCNKSWKSFFPKRKNGTTFYRKWLKTRHKKFFEMLFIISCKYQCEYCHMNRGWCVQVTLFVIKLTSVVKVKWSRTYKSSRNIFPPTFISTFSSWKREIMTPNPPVN